MIRGDLEVHSHDFVEILVVASGSGSHTSTAGDVEVNTGDVFVLRPGVWHGFRTCQDLVVGFVGISVSAMATDLAFLREDPLFLDLLWTGPFAFGRRGVLDARIPHGDASKALDEIQTLANDLDAQTGNRIYLLGRLLTVIGRLAGHASAHDTAPPQPRRIHPAVDTVIARFEGAPEHDWHLKDLARSVNLDPAYLTRLFRQHVGIAPIGYLARIRVERAASLLARTTAPASRVGALVGWPDPNNFTRRFRDLMGITPTAYRRHLVADEAADPRQPNLL